MTDIELARVKRAQRGEVAKGLAELGPRDPFSVMQMLHSLWRSGAIDGQQLARGMTLAEKLRVS